MIHYKDIEDIPLTFGPHELSKILGISKNKAYEVVNRHDFPKNPSWPAHYYQQKALY